jgi:GNAT superfamily N-acetyltransferase
MEGLDLPIGGSLVAFTAEERPDLWEDARSLFQDVWPEYNNHGNESGRYFGALFPHYAYVQILLFDRETERVVARGRTIPFRWDGSLDDLPDGIDAVGLRALEGPQAPTALSALAAEVATDHQGRGLSRVVLQAMAEVARQAGLSALVAPVRPSWKDQYPLIPIERYAYWVRADGLPFDPWLRVHARLGATILRPEPESLRIEGPIGDWERWTEMRFPEDGEYTFPLGLAPLQVHDGVGSYWEPNVWVLHDV